jgi:hypothetical protein
MVKRLVRKGTPGAKRRKQPKVAWAKISPRTAYHTGIATNICVFFTANDAFLRGYRVCVARVCEFDQTTRDVLAQMKTVLKAHVLDSASLHGKQLLDRPV